MSLRDDLNKLENALYAYAGSLSLNGSEIEALDRLRAALDSLESAQGAVAPKLSPAAEKWLEALPELMELQSDFRVTRGPYYARGSYLTVRDNISRSIEHMDEMGVGPSGRFQAVPFAHMEDAELLAALRNALHEAAALHNATDDEKEKP